MKVPKYSYRIPDFYGDDNWHIENTDERFSIENPLTFTVSGESFTIPAIWGNVTKLQSNWLWRYGFSSLSDSSTYSLVDEYGTTRTSYYFYYYRYYNSSIGSNNVPVTQLDVGIDYSDRWYYVGSNYRILQAYQLNSSLNRSSISGDYMIRFANTGDWYVRSRPGYPAAENRAIVVKFTADYKADLPSDMYSISDGVLTWNTTHPIYKLLNGFKVEAIAS